MDWAGVIGQERVLAALQRAIEQDRVAHAYLFHGPEGCGKRAVALAFARALLGQDGPDAARKVDRLIHPDLHVLFPQPKDASTDDITARLARLAENPYAAIDYVRRPSLDDPTKTSNKQAFYAADRVVEDLQRPMSFKPVEGRYKIAILTDAEQMRTEAANAFLKLLEEPTPQTVFILTTYRVDRLLPTILSRCQRYRFDALTVATLEQALVRRENLAPAQAAALARMADGSYTRALDLRGNDELMAGRDEVLRFLRLSYTQDINKLADLIEEWARLGREQLKGRLRLLLSWLRDLMLYRTIGADAALVNIDQQQAIANFVGALGQADLNAMVAFAEEAIELTERNVHLGGLLIVLTQSLGQAMRGQAPAGLFLALAEPIS